VKWARAKAWCVIALGVVAIDGCRFRYEQLEKLVSRSDGGVATNGGDGASAGALGGAAEPADGGAGTTEEGGAAGGLPVGGTNGTAGGTGGTNTSGTNAGGDNSGGSSTGGTGEGPGVCVPDATCSCDVFQGHDYRFCPVVATHASEMTACQSANMVLIRIDSAEENAWLLQQFTAQGMFVGSGSPIVFLGGDDLQVSGQWRWQDGTLFWDGGPVGGLYTNFNSPPRINQGDCLGMTSDGKWGNRSCNSGNATLACESP